MKDTYTGSDPVGDALIILKVLADGGSTLTLRHVDAAARIAGADPGLVRDIILSPVAR